MFIHVVLPSKYCLLFILFLILAGCDRTANIDPQLEVSLTTTRLPLIAAVYYSPEFQAYTDTSTRDFQPRSKPAPAGGPVTVIPMGAPSVEMFNQVLAEMFAEVIRLPRISPERDEGSEFDILIEPEIADFSQKWPYFKATITYRVTVYDKRRSKLATLNSTGSSQDTGEFTQENLLGPGALDPAGWHTKIAMRRAIAGFVSKFQDEPQIRRYLADIGIDLDAVEGVEVASKVQSERMSISGATFVSQGGGDHDRYSRCIANSLSAITPALHVIPPKEFADQIYPWFEPSTRPTNVDALARMLARKGVRNRIEQLGVRYLIMTLGQTVEGEPSGHIACGAGSGGAGCLGLAWRHRETFLSAIAWDLETATSVGEAQAKVSGTSVMPAFILPIPLTAPTEGEACTKVAKDLAGLLNLKSDKAKN
jgi:hypothetical protein